MKMKYGKGKFPQEHTQPCGSFSNQGRTIIINVNYFLTSCISGQNFKEEKIPLFYNIIATMRDIQDRELNEA